MESNNDNLMEKLSNDFRAYIKSNAVVMSKFRKIMRWLFILTGIMLFSLLTGLSFIIYEINQPASATGVAMKQVEDINKSLLIQRRFVQMDREDITRARSQIVDIMKMQDSVQKQQDSVLNSNYKRALKK